MKIYKLEFEVVSPLGSGSKFYSGEKPNTHPSQVPDEFWHKVSKSDYDLFEKQYETLLEWSTSDCYPIKIL